MPGITRRLELRIAGEASTLSAPLNLYRGDRGIDIFFRIMDFSYDFTGTNLLRNIGSARYNAIVVKPDGSNYVTPTQPIVDNEVKFTITKDLTDEMTEIGTYTLQFLLHGAGDSRVAIPPITIVVKELIADVADGADGQANYSTTNKTTIKAGQATIEARWEIGELITADKLNWTRDKAIQGAETSQANSNKISVLEPKVATLEKKVAPLQADVNTLKEKVNDFQNINVMNQEATGVGDISLSDTYDGVTKDLVVKGKTLKNIKELSVPLASGGDLSNKGDIYRSTSRGSGTMYLQFSFGNAQFLKPNTTYTMIVKNYSYNVESSLGIRLYDRTASTVIGIFRKINNNTFTVITSENLNTNNVIQILFYGGQSQEDYVELSNKIVILEGDYTNNPPVSYFDSITSVGEQEDNKIKIKSVGKNLCDKNDFYKQLYEADISSNKHAITRVVEDGRNCFKIMQNGSIKQAYRNRFKPNTAYTISFFCKQKSTNNSTLVIKYTDGSQIVLYAEPSMGVFKKFSVTTSPSKQIDYISAFWSDGKELFIDEDTIQIEENTVATNYEQYIGSYKEITLPFEGGLKSLPNGECDTYKNGVIIQRLHKMLIPHTYDFIPYASAPNQTKTIAFYANTSILSHAWGGDWNNLLSNRFNNKNVYNIDEEGVAIDSNRKLIFRISRDKLTTHDVTGFKKWLQTNETYVIGKLQTPKTYILEGGRGLNNYEGVTHFFQENNIVTNIKMLAPISLNKSIGRVQDENASLTKENRILKEDNKIVAEALLNIMQPINTLDEKGEEYKPHTQEEIINRLIEILSR